MKINNVAAYKFVRLENLPELKRNLLAECKKLNIKGTILLSEEGINLSLSASINAMELITAYFRTYPAFYDLNFKESFSETCAFKRMLIKIKPEIITFREAAANPSQLTGQYISPHELKQWLDEQRDIVVLDTRNTFEVEFGTFEKAVDLKIDRFTDFPKAVEERLDESLKEKPIVMFCTGGIRCEKASAAMLNRGFKQVYQLDGGILNYFEQCGGNHYQGSCFVFDDRIALNSNLEPVA